MIELLFIVPTIILAALLWNERRAHERAEHAWRLERVGLLNRIQAPEVAAFEPEARKETDTPNWVPYDDDQAWEAYMEAKAAGEAV